MHEKIQLRETVIVEGRYDKIKLSECISSPIIETGGFRVFKDKEKQSLIRMIAERRGILVMTDVDSAGFVIRNFLKGIVPEEQIYHAYIPTVAGKERRKSEQSKEGILGVEGIDKEALLSAVRQSGAHIIDDSVTAIQRDEFTLNTDIAQEFARINADKAQEITKQDFFDYGLSGSENSAQYREELLSSLGMPKYLTTNAMITALNCFFTKEEFEAYLTKLTQ